MPGYSAKWNRLAAQEKQRLLDIGVDPMCWLCRYPIDLGLSCLDPWSLTFDHIVPRVQGGQDVIENMAPSHRSCNTRRSNALKKANNSELLTSREW